MANVFQLHVDSVFATCIFILGAIVLHFILKNRPSSQLYLIWVFVLIRLLVPLSINHNFEFGSYTVPQGIVNVMTNKTNTLTSDTSAIDDIEETDRMHTTNKMNYDSIIQFVWFAGVICFVIHYLFRILLLRKKIKRSIQLTGYENVWMWDDYTSACVIGLFRPHIYVPLDCDGENLSFIVRHEAQHIKHFDYIFVYLFYFAFAFNWYNPLVWLAYKMAIQDVEKACDERVLLNSSARERQAYAMALVDFYKGTSPKSMVIGFGTSNIVKRIKNIGENKKQKRIYTVLIVLFCCAFSGACSLIHTSTDYPRTDYQKIADEIGKEEIGASIPSIIYADSEKCIFYDYHGVFIYEFNSRKLSDYISFSEIGFTSSTQGDNATFAFSGEKGKVIYITNYTKLYVHDCDKKSGNLTDYSSTNMPETSVDSLPVSDKTENNAISEIYELADNTQLYWTYEGAEGKYSELRLILDKNGDVEKYSIFT